jgi:hypothetical protein
MRLFIVTLIPIVVLVYVLYERSDEVLVTKEDLEVELRPGMHVEIARGILSEYTDDFAFSSKESFSRGYPEYPWVESEVGYYMAAIHNIRPNKRGIFPIGTTGIGIRLGVTRDDIIIQVLIEYYITGVP